MISIFLFEVPTGFIADYFGKKNAIIISKMLLFFHFLLYIIYPGMTIFLLVNVIWGLSQTFASGAESVYVKQLIDQSGQEQSYMQVIAQRKSIVNAGSIGLTILSSMLFSWNETYVFIISGVMTLMSLFIMVALPSVDSEKRSGLDSSILTTFNKAVNQSFWVFYKHPTVLKIAIIDALCMGSIIFIFETYQLRFTEMNIPSFYFGYIYASFKLWSVVGNLVTAKFESYTNTPMFMAITVLAVAFSIYLFSLNVGIIFFIISIIIQQITYVSWILVVESLTVEASSEIENPSMFLSVYSQFVGLFRSIFSVGLFFISSILSFQSLVKIISISLILFTIKPLYKKFKKKSDLVIKK